VGSHLTISHKVKHVLNRYISELKIGDVREEGGGGGGHRMFG
jgi:hypothetical protein